MSKLTGLAAFPNGSRPLGPRHADGLVPPPSLHRIGEPTEAALKILVEKLEIPGIARSEDPFVSCSQYNSFWESKYQKLATLEFSRDRKSMSVLCRSLNGGGNRLLVKGAPDLLIGRCVQRIGAGIRRQSRPHRSQGSRLGP